jgi:hypothetical protein
MLCAEADLMLPGDQGGSTWCANARSSEHLSETRALLSQGIKVWCPSMRVAIAAKTRSHVFGNEQQDIGRILLGTVSRSAKH